MERFLYRNEKTNQISFPLGPRSFAPPSPSKFPQGQALCLPSTLQLTDIPIEPGLALTLRLSKGP